MQRGLKTHWLLILTLCVTLAFSGCEGSEPRNQVDDTVKELSGQKKVEQMDKLKMDIGAIQTRQDDRMKQAE